VPNLAHAQFIAHESSDPIEGTRALSATCARQLMGLPASETSARRPTSSPGASRMRPQRHKPTSVASPRLILAGLLFRCLLQRPYCHRLLANPDAQFL
jgi:hypothetical protein